MQPSDAYPLLVKQLEAARQLPPRELAALAGRPALESFVDIAGEQVSLEMSVAWVDRAHSAVCVTAHARGSSTWHTEHLQESIIVAIGRSAAQLNAGDNR